METHKINGIELLMPLVPKDAGAYFIDDDSLLCYLTGTNAGGYGEVDLIPHGVTIKDILGTCWREGDKLVCEGFDPYAIFEFKVDFENWLGRSGITIPEGFKRVIIKVN